MIKHTMFVRFSPDIERSEASRRWRNEIGARHLRLPGLVRYVQNRVVLTTTNDGLVEGEAGFHGLTEMWWETAAGYEAAVSSPEWAEAEGYAGRLLDAAWVARGMSAEIEERIKRVGLGATDDGVSTPPGKPVKLVGLLRYRDDLSRDAANNYWTTHHGGLALKISDLGHYVQNHAIRPAGGLAPAGVLGFDGYSEAWFEDLPTYERAMASQSWEDLVDDGPALFDMSAFLSGIVEEDVLKG